MAVDLLPGEQVLWQGAPVRRTPFLRTDLGWLWFHTSNSISDCWRSWRSWSSR